MVVVIFFWDKCKKNFLLLTFFFVRRGWLLLLRKSTMNDDHFGCQKTRQKILMGSFLVFYHRRIKINGYNICTYYIPIVFLFNSWWFKTGQEDMLSSNGLPNVTRHKWSILRFRIILLKKLLIYQLWLFVS